jgi:hypothetical protein
VEFGHVEKVLWGYIWVAGRFSNRHKRYIREEVNKFNKQVIAKLIIIYISNLNPSKTLSPWLEYRSHKGAALPKQLYYLI